MYIPTIALLVALASAQSTGSFCSTVSQQSCKTSGTAFCSSYLKVPAKTATITSIGTVTTTTTSTVTGQTTATVTQGTVTRPVTATSTATLTVTSTSTKYTTTATTTITDTFSTATQWQFTGGCTVTAAPNAQNKKRQATLSKPPCLAAYSSGAQLSSACSCLSISTSTATITSTSTRTATVTAVAIVQRTTTTTVQSTALVTVSTSTTTSTSTIVSTTSTATTTTSIAAIATVLASTFTLEGTQRDSNFYRGVLRPLNSTSNYIGITFNRDSNADPFTLRPAGSNGPNCVLTSLASNTNGQQGLISKQLSGNHIRFAAPGTFAAQNVVLCQIQSSSGQIFCRNPTSKTYNAGDIDQDVFWTIPEGQVDGFNVMTAEAVLDD